MVLSANVNTRLVLIGPRNPVGLPAGTIWLAAVVTPFLHLHATAGSLFEGFSIGVLVSLATIAWNAFRAPDPRGLEDLALSVRQARPSDAADLARIYIESWQDTYAGLLSHSLLTAMSHKNHAARWQAPMRGPGAVLVAEAAAFGPIAASSVFARST